MSTLHLVANQLASSHDCDHDYYFRKMRQELLRSITTGNSPLQQKQQLLLFTALDPSGDTALYCALQKQQQQKVNRNNDVLLSLKERLIDIMVSEMGKEYENNEFARWREIVVQMLKVDAHFQQFVSLYPPEMLYESLRIVNSDGLTAMEYCIQNHMIDEVLYMLLYISQSLVVVDGEQCKFSSPSPLNNDFQSIDTMAESLLTKLQHEQSGQEEEDEQCSSFERKLASLFVEMVPNRHILLDSYMKQECGDELFTSMIGYMITRADPVMAIQYLRAPPSSNIGKGDSENKVHVLPRTTVLHQCLSDHPPRRLTHLYRYLFRNAKPMIHIVRGLWSRSRNPHSELMADNQTMRRCITDLFNFIHPMVLLWFYVCTRVFHQDDSIAGDPNSLEHVELYQQIRQALLTVDSHGNTMLHYSRQSLIACIMILFPVIVKLDGSILSQLQSVRNYGGETVYDGMPLLSRLILGQITKFALDVPAQRKRSLYKLACLFLFIFAPYLILVVYLTVKVISFIWSVVRSKL